jgi:hypothetical protein
VEGGVILDGGDLVSGQDFDPLVEDLEGFWRAEAAFKRVESLGEHFFGLQDVLDIGVLVRN